MGCITLKRMDYLLYFDIFDRLDTEETEVLTKKRKCYENCEDPFSLKEKQFRACYSFSKQYARKIVELIRRDIEREPRVRGLSVELQVCTALKSWARQEGQDHAADTCGITQQTINTVCRRVAGALVNQASRFLHMPATVAEQEAVMTGFRNICGLNNVIGVVDCMLIKTRKVNSDSTQWSNGKGFSTLKVQVVCDSRLKIRDIVALWSDSPNNTHLFKESSLHKRFEQGEFNGILLGDSGYCLLNHLFTPVQATCDAKEEAYNRSHRLTRNTIDKCFRIWKQRFRSLSHGFSVSMMNVESYVTALAILHNIAIDMKENIDFIMSEEENDKQHLPSQAPDSIAGLESRRLFIETNF